MPIEFIPAVCPNCGGELRVPEDRKAVKCMYCGYDIIVHETKSDSSRPSVKNWLKLADAVLDTNSEEAYGYYQKVLEVEPENWNAWYGKAKSTFAQYTIANSASSLSALLANQRVNEIINNVQKAIQFCPEKEKEKFKDSAINPLLYFAVQYNSNLLFLPASINFFEIFERKKLFFDLIDFILLIASSNRDDYITLVEFGLDGCIELMKKIPPDGDYSSWEQQIRGKYQKYINKIMGVNPTYQPKALTKKNENKSSSGCFIATATMGSSDDFYVITLSQFRDKKLTKTGLGRLFIGLYYRFSPPIARLIANSLILKRISLWFIIKPSVFIVKFLR